MAGRVRAALAGFLRAPGFHFPGVSLPVLRRLEESFDQLRHGNPAGSSTGGGAGEGEERLLFLAAACSWICDLAVASHHCRLHHFTQQQGGPRHHHHHQQQQHSSPMATATPHRSPAAALVRNGSGGSSRGGGVGAIPSPYKAILASGATAPAAFAGLGGSAALAGANPSPAAASPPPLLGVSVAVDSSRPAQMMMQALPHRVPSPAVPRRRGQGGGAHSGGRLAVRAGMPCAASFPAPAPPIPRPVPWMPVPASSLLAERASLPA